MKLFVLLQLRYIVEVGAPIKTVCSRPREPGPNLRPHPPTPQLRLGPAHTKLTNLLPIIAAQIFEKRDFLPGKPNTYELRGGAGKFQGLQASIVIASTLVKSTYEGIQQLVGHKKGTYKIVRTN